MKILDCQVDSGKNLFGPDSDLDIYIKERPKEITTALVIPTGTHILQTDQGIETSCVWSFENGKIKFFKELDINGVKSKEYFPENPYRQMNLEVLKKIRAINKSEKDVRLHFVPKFHPHLDTQSAIEDLLEQPETVAVKIQGIASYSSPEDIPEWLVQSLRAKEMPLLIHTDFYSDKIQKNQYRNPFLHYIVNKNDALNWVIFGMNNDIKMYLAHGLMLSREASELVNKNDNFIVGIGPDFMLNYEKESLHVEGDYLDCLLKFINPKKLAFNTDYAWNVFERGNWSNRDWDSHNRIIKNLSELNLSKYEQKIMHDNASDFFRI